MPTVPFTFAPSVDQQPSQTPRMSAPFVQPMENHAPTLLSQVGNATEQTGLGLMREGQTIGDRVRDTMDESLAKQADTQFLQNAITVLHDPQSGYLNTRGMDAQTQRDAAVVAIAKARQDARETLTNPLQQRMFDMAANDHTLNFHRQILDHQHDQVTQYGIQQGQDRADSMNILARMAYLDGRMSDYKKYASASQDEVLNVAALHGAAPDSDVAQAMLREKRTDLVRGVTIGLLDKHQFDEAKQYFTLEQGNIDMRAAEQLGTAVKAEYDRNLTETKGDSFLAAAQKGGSVPYTYGSLATGSTINPMKITDVPGSPRPDGRTHDGYDIAMPAGTAVTAPLDGKVVKVWNDEQFGGGLSMRVQLADGNTLGIAHLSAANLNEGDSVNKGQVIALSGKSGNATGDVLHVALQDPDGKYVDYFAASKAQPDPAGKADPNVLERAIQMAKSDGSLDPYQQKQVVRYMESEHSKERAIQEQQYQGVKQNVVDQLVQNDGRWDLIPASLKTQLRPSDVQGFQDMQDAEKLAKSDLDTQIKYYSLPPEQRTPAWVKDNYQNLKPGTFMGLLKNADELQRSADNLPEAKVQDTMFRASLADNGFKNLLDPKTDDDKLKLLQLRSSIDDVATSMQGVLRRKLKPEEWQNVLDSQLKNQVFEERGRMVPWPAMGKIALSQITHQGPFITQDDLHYSQPVPAGLAPAPELRQTFVMSGGKKIYLADIPPARRMEYEIKRVVNGLPISEQAIADDWVHFGMPK